MGRAQEAAVVEEIAVQLGEAETIFAVDYRGIGVPQAAELRGRLAEADASFRIVKNRLAKRAAESAGTDDLTELFEGPTALTVVKGDPVTAAKAIADFKREHDVPTYKGGIMDGAPLDPEQFSRIARLPGLEVLHAQLLGAVASPVTGVARGLSQLLAGLASQLGQIQEQELVSGEAEPESADEEADTEAEEPTSGGTEEEQPEAEAEEATNGGEEEPKAEENDN